VWAAAFNPIDADICLQVKVDLSTFIRRENVKTKRHNQDIHQFFFEKKELKKLNRVCMMPGDDYRAPSHQ
jgi:hypothetical protein